MFDSLNKFFFNRRYLSNGIYYIQYPIPKRRNDLCRLVAVSFAVNDQREYGQRERRVHAICSIPNNGDATKQSTSHEVTTSNAYLDQGIALGETSYIAAIDLY